MKIRRWLTQLFCSHIWWPASPSEMVRTSTRAGFCKLCGKWSRWVYMWDFDTLAEAAFWRNTQKAQALAKELTADLD